MTKRHSKYYEIKRYVEGNLDFHTDRLGDINLTALAEDVCSEYGLHNYSIPQWVDELCFEVADKAGLIN